MVFTSNFLFKKLIQSATVQNINGKHHILEDSHSFDQVTKNLPEEGAAHNNE